MATRKRAYDGFKVDWGKPGVQIQISWNCVIAIAIGIILVLLGFR